MSSTLAKLGAKDSKTGKFANLVTMIIQYEKDMADADKNLEIKGKTLERANVENASWHFYYDQRRAEIANIVRFLESEVEKVRGNLYKSYKEGHSIALSDREIGRYIDTEQAYLTVYRMLLEVKELHDKYQGLVESFTTRGYALNNIVRIRVAGLEDVEIV